MMTSFVHNHDRKFIFVGSTNFNRDGLVKHLNRDLHLKAAKIYGTEEEILKANLKVENDSKDFKKIDQVVYLKDDKLVLPIFKSIYFAAKNDLSLSTCESLCSFLESNGVQVQKHYRNRPILKEMLLSIANDIRMKLLRELDHVNAVGLQIDESTDTSLTKILSINIKYIHEGEVKNRFLCVKEVEKGDAQTIYDTLTQTLLAMGIFSKISSICTDGAQVKISSQNEGDWKTTQRYSSFVQFALRCP